MRRVTILKCEGFKDLSYGIFICSIIGFDQFLMILLPFYWIERWLFNSDGRFLEYTYNFNKAYWYYETFKLMLCSDIEIVCLKFDNFSNPNLNYWNVCDLQNDCSRSVNQYISSVLGHNSKLIGFLNSRACLRLRSKPKAVICTPQLAQTNQ